MAEPDPPEEPRAGPSDPPLVPTEEEVVADLEGLGALDPGEAAPHAEPERRRPSTVGGAFYLCVLAGTVVGLVIVSSGDWRLGVRCVAGSLMVAAFLRLLLPGREAGMLAVRHRLVDCLMLGGVGGALAFLAQTIPNQPGF